MALRNIRVMGDEILTKRCKEVTEMTERNRELVTDMLETMYDADGVGLAAPQVGILKRIAVAPVPKVNIDEIVWKKFLEAIRNDYVVEFDYNGRWNTETSHRKFAPYQFLFDDGSCFIFGYSYERNAERIFSLSRIKNLEVTSEHFDLPEDFDFSSRCGGGKFGAFMSDKAVDFVIDLYNDAREIVKERILADNQKVTNFEEEERTRVEFSSTQTLRVMEWILSQGSHAVPISPDWFVDNWKLTVEAMIKRVNGIFD